MQSTKRAHVCSGVHEKLGGVVHVQLQVRRHKIESEHIFGNELEMDVVVAYRGV